MFSKEMPIHNYKRLVYELSLSIYPVAVCGEDLQTGSPVEVSAQGNDPYKLKCGIDTMLLSTECDGRCFVEMTIEKNGEYYDRDEQWVVIDHNEKKVGYDV